jgi:hypothetical protein
MDVWRIVVAGPTDTRPADSIQSPTISLRAHTGFDDLSRAIQNPSADFLNLRNRPVKQIIA